jgi:transposase
MGRPINLFLTAGQTSDALGARALLGFLPKAKTLLADRGYDANWFRKALIEREILPCIPGRKARKVPVEYDMQLYHATPQGAPPDREHVRPAQGLAVHRNPLRPLRRPVPLGLLPRRRRALLVVSPEPRGAASAAGGCGGGRRRGGAGDGLTVEPPRCAAGPAG